MEVDIQQKSIADGGKTKKRPPTATNPMKSTAKPMKINPMTSVEGIPTAVVKDVELQKAEGTLSGLASLKRLGNVKVLTDPAGRNSTIKAKFTLGPLILHVEKLTKRGSVKNLKSATARTNAMLGRIKFSVVNDRASLLSIKLQQPKRVTSLHSHKPPVHLIFLLIFLI